MIRSCVRRSNLSISLPLAVLVVAVFSLPHAFAAAQGENLANLATAGRFDAVLEQLNAIQAEKSNPRAASLIADITRYREHEQNHHADRTEEYNKTLEKIVEQLEKDDLNKALFSAAEARSLALDKSKLTEEPQIVALVEKTRTAAAEAEKEGKWLDALNLYRGLDLLFSIDGDYREDVKRITNVVRMLRIYAPNKLNEIYEERAARLGDDKEDDFEPLQLDIEEWPKRLEAVRWDMMRQSIERAARFHIEGEGYKPMLLGSISALKTLINTPDLQAEFEGLANAQGIDSFSKQLQMIEIQVKAHDKTIGQNDALRYLSRIRSANTMTINLPEGVLVYEMAEGATSALDDYSSVIWPHDLAELYRTLQGNFQGVGILLARDTKRLLVKSPLENGPAIKAGIRAGDVIVTVNGQPTKDWSLTKAVENITGPEGTKVVLGIERGHKIDPFPEKPGDDEPLDDVDLEADPKDKQLEEATDEAEIEKLTFELVRQEIKIGSVLGWERSDQQGNWNYWIDKNWGIGYVRITQFLPQTAADLDKAVKQLKSEGQINGLVIDLRFNPGGLLRAAVDISDRFIDNGVLVSTVDVNNVQQEAHYAKDHNTYDKFPVVVLVNQGSASASEIVSGALQAYGRATIVGMRSFGKGSVQDMFNIQNGQALLKLTTQYYRLPNNRIIHRKPKATEWGIEPDIVIDMSDQQVADSLRFRSELDVLHVDGEKINPDELPMADEIFEKGIDPQLEGAVVMLKTTLYARQSDHLKPGQKQARD